MPFDEFGIEIKPKKAESNSAVDEFGIPIKKKSGTQNSNSGTTPISQSKSPSQSQLSTSNVAGSALSSLGKSIGASPAKPEAISSNFEGISNVVSGIADTFSNIIPEQVKTAVNTVSNAIPVVVNEVAKAKIKEDLGYGVYDEVDDNKLFAYSQSNNKNNLFTKKDSLDTDVLLSENGYNPTILNDSQKIDALKNLRNKISAIFVSDNYRGQDDVNLKLQEQRLNGLINKIEFKKGIETPLEEKDVEALQRQYADKTLLQKGGEVLLDATVIPIWSGNKPNEVSSAYKDERVNLKTEFFEGLKLMSLRDPEQYKRINDQIATGKPMSQTQISNLENLGLQVKSTRSLQKLISGEQDINTYNESQKLVGQTYINNLAKHPEILKASFRDFVGNEWEKDKDRLGSTWSKGFEYVPDSYIEQKFNEYSKGLKINPNEAFMVDILEATKKNEGWMIGQNSIPKSGGIRDVLEGAATPFRGVYNSLTPQSGNDSYIESQSQEAINIAESELDSEKSGYLAVRRGVFKGAGEFAAQYALAQVGAGFLGATGRVLNVNRGLNAIENAALAGSNRAALSSVEQGVLAAEEATTVLGVEANLARNAVQSAEAAGGRALLNEQLPTIFNSANLTKGKEFLSTVITSYAQSYDSNFKRAQEYTANDEEAANIARVQSLMEGGTETIFSPFDIGRGIYKGIFGNEAVTKKLFTALKESDFTAQKTLVKDIIRGGLNATKTAAGEISEEFITQTTDLIANSIYNPATFENRDIIKEYQDVAIQTGLSMALPSLLSGVGAARSNTLAKASVLISADDAANARLVIDEDYYNHNIDTKTYLAKTLIVNEAEKANSNLPLKDNGSEMNASEKEAYVFNTVSQKLLERKLDPKENPNLDVEEPRLKKQIADLLTQRQQILSNGTNTTTTATVSEPIQSNAGATQEQGNQATVQASTNEAGQPNAVAGTAVQLSNEDLIAANKELEESKPLRPIVFPNDPNYAEITAKYEKDDAARLAAIMTKYETAAKNRQASPASNERQQAEEISNQQGTDVEAVQATTGNEATRFDAAETQFQALDRLTQNLPTDETERAAEIKRRAAEHDASYKSFLGTQGNEVQGENASLDRVANFGKLTEQAMRKFLSNPAQFEGEQQNFENGSRIDENGNVIGENDFVILKEKVKQLRADKNIDEIAQINAAPAQYLIDNNLKKDESVIDVTNNSSVPIRANRIVASERTSAIEPTVQGENIVTLSGDTQVQRQAKIEQRKKETSLTDKQRNEQNLLNLVDSYNGMRNGRLGKLKPEGNDLLNRIKLRAKELGIDIDGRSGEDIRAGYRNNNGKKAFAVIQRTNKERGDKSINENGKIITEREPIVGEVFNQLLDAGIFPNAYTLGNVRMSDAQLDGTISDILDGIPSERATKYLDDIERMIDEDAFEVGEGNVNGFPLNELLSVQSETIGAPLTEQDIVEWLSNDQPLDTNEESEISEQDEIDNFSQLILENESTTTEEGSPNEVQQPKPIAKVESNPAVQSNEGQPAEAAAVVSEESGVDNTKAFNKKVDSIADSLIDFLTPKSTRGINAQGGSIESIVRGAAAVIKKAYAASQNIQQAVEAGMQYFKDNWDSTNNGDLPEDALRQKLTDDLTKLDITHASTKVERESYGLSERVQREETANESLLQQADEKISENYNVAKLINKINTTEYVPTALESAILTRYIATLKSEIKNGATNEKIQEYSRALAAAEKGGSAAGAALQARKLASPIDATLADFFVRDYQANMNADLTDEQKSTVEKEYEDISAAQKAYDEKLAKLEEENAKLKAEAEVRKEAKSKKQNKTKEDFVKEREDIVASMKEALRKASGQTYAVPLPYLPQLMAIAPDVTRLVRSYAQEGLVNLGEVISKVKNDLQDVADFLTENDIRDIIAGNYNEPQRTRGDVTRALTDLRTQARLQNKLDKLVNGEIPKEENKKRELNREIESLRQQIKDFLKEKQRIEDEDINVSSQEANQTALQALKTRTKTQIDALENELNSGDLIVEREKPTGTMLDEEAKVLRDKLFKLRQEREIRLIKQEAAGRAWYKRLYDLAANVLNVPRTILSSMDFSAPLRQGLIPTISHPILASKAFVEMFRQAWSQKRFERWYFDLQESADYNLMMESKLGVTNPVDPTISAREEAFMSNLVEKIPIIGGAVTIKGVTFGGLVKGSERAYSGYLNKMRVDLFRQGADVLRNSGYTFDNSPENYKALAKWVNTATGRGSIGGKLENAVPILNSVFFSPRLIAARLNALNPLYYAKLPAPVRVSALKDMTKFVGFIATTLALFSLGGDDDDDLKVEFDPRSSDFLKLRKGNVRYDITGGFNVYMRVIAQMASGQKKNPNTGVIKKLDGKSAFGEDRSDVILRFFRGKLAPVPASIWNLTVGKNIIGEEATIKTEINRNVLPLVASDFSEAIKDEGVKSIFTTLLPSTFGIGVQRFDDAKKK